MTLSINLSPDAEAKLRREAAAAGKDINSFVQEAIEKLAAKAPPPPSNGHAAEKLVSFNQWVASHQPRSRLADDSRDALYGDERD